MAIVRLAPNVPVEADVKWCDVVSGQYGAQIKMRGQIGGGDGTVYLPGKLADNITELTRAGALGSVPTFDEAALPKKGLTLQLRQKRLVLMLKQDAGEKYGRLIVSVPGAPAGGNGHAGTHAAPAAPAPEPDAHHPAAAPVHPERKPITAIYLECLDWAIASVGPRLTRADIGADPQAIVSAAATIFIQRCREER